MAVFLAASLNSAYFYGVFRGINFSRRDAVYSHTQFRSLRAVVCGSRVFGFAFWLPFLSRCDFCIWGGNLLCLRRPTNWIDTGGHDCPWPDQHRIILNISVSARSTGATAARTPGYPGTAPSCISNCHHHSHPHTHPNRYPITNGNPITPTTTSTATNIPTPSETVPPPTNTPLPTATECSPPTGWVRYTVQFGDSWFSLSQLYGLSTLQLQQANCLDSSSGLYVGQQILLPYLIAFPTSPPATPLTASPTSRDSLEASPTLTEAAVTLIPATQPFETPSPTQPEPTVTYAQPTRTAPPPTVTRFPSTPLPPTPVTPTVTQTIPPLPTPAPP